MGVTTACTARYTKIESGYMGQIVEWPEVITEGRTLDDCREMVEDALREMVLAYREQGKPLPITEAVLEPVLIEV